MQKNHFKISFVVLCLALVSACSSPLPKPQELSGLIKDYRLLSAVKNPSGNRVLRRVDDSFTRERYPKLYLRPVFFAPNPQPDSQISETVLERIRVYFDDALRARISQQVILADTAEEASAIVSVALVSVKTKIEGLKPQEIIPLRAVISGINYVAGGRDHEVSMVVEMQVEDGKTGKVLVEVVNKGEGLNLENAEEALQLSHLQPLIDQWVKDIELGFRMF